MSTRRWLICAYAYCCVILGLILAKLWFTVSKLTPRQRAPLLQASEQDL